MNQTNSPESFKYYYLSSSTFQVSRFDASDHRIQVRHASLLKLLGHIHERNGEIQIYLFFTPIPTAFEASEQIIYINSIGIRWTAVIKGSMVPLLKRLL